MEWQTMSILELHLPKDELWQSVRWLDSRIHKKSYQIWQTPDFYLGKTKNKNKKEKNETEL